MQSRYRPFKAALLTMALTALAGCSNEAPPAQEVIRPVKLFQVTDDFQGDIRRFPATIQSTEESQISFRIPGELTRLAVNTAQYVEKGELLAQLDDRDIRNELDLRQADFDLADTNYKRMVSLWESKVVSQAEMDTASANLKSARASLKLAKDKLAYTTLTAPFSGRIARTDVENHQFVQAQQTILVLQDDKMLEVHIQMPESVLTRIRKDSVDPDYHPYVTFPGTGESNYPVTYKEHSTSVSPGTQSYEVTFTLPAPEELTVYPGMGAILHMDLSRLSGKPTDLSSFTVPLTAVLKDDASGKSLVWVFDEQSGAINPVEVTTGRITQNGINILSGLNGGEQIVAAGLSSLSAGMKVKPLVRERGL
ncbi:efflux RND transporter periplasmic adaptor subunit [Parendozoicomonas haliclonae]|uniref:Toluene efflux pump periplasmic linker protein TtgD n=1 Tax=Parendozoicomonas haliclonae TaxID=1960125 RepID=A0A1X7ADX0_9GAMM|nr:efflux RND transporter periplasmic adaptor subunit [Parendozoicomonas haliclonae]SMA32839.1 Toluene efflux pump periplasmic linker protein TtgD precursor [Parendozoicomonas haliclonae]